MVLEGEGEDTSDKLEVIKIISTVYPNQHQEHSPCNNYVEDQLRIQALKTIPINVLSLDQRRLLKEHGYVQVQEDREERNWELIDTSMEDEPGTRMEEGKVERLLRAEVEKRGGAEDRETAGEEEEEEVL